MLAFLGNNRTESQVMDTQIKSFFLSPTPQYLTLSPIFYLSCKQSLSDLMFSIIFCAENSLIHNSKLGHIDVLKTPISQAIGCLHTAPLFHHVQTNITHPLYLWTYFSSHVFLFFIYIHSVLQPKNPTVIPDSPLFPKSNYSLCTVNSTL